MSIIDKYIDYKITQWQPSKHELLKGMVVKWNWMARQSLGVNKK